MKKIKYLLVALIVATSSLLMTSKVSAASSDDRLIINDPLNVWSVDIVNYVVQLKTTWSEDAKKSFELKTSNGYLISNLNAKIEFSGMLMGEANVESTGNVISNNSSGSYMYNNEHIVPFTTPPGFSITITFKLIPDPNAPVIPVPTERPAISGQDTVINNVDSPYTESEIRAIAIKKVTDAYDGDITDLVVVTEDNYTASKNKVGTFTITYSVTNSSNLTSTFIVNVLNRDFVNPVITGEPTSTVSYKTKVTNEDIIAKYSANDNYDGVIGLVITSSNYEANKLGTFTFRLQAKDSSGNTAVATHTLNVIDDIAPVITDTQEGTIQVSFLKKLSNSELLFGLSATDEIDGELTSKIKIIENQLTDKKGVYSVIYEVSDNANNKTTYERRYEVISTEVPIFYVSRNLISIEDANRMTTEQLALIISNYHNIEMKSFEVITNDYETNEATTGEYLLSMKIVDVNDQEHIFDNYKINVFNKSNLPKENEEPKAKTIWQKIADFFVNLWNGIKAFFKWLRKILAAPFKWVISLFK